MSFWALAVFLNNTYTQIHWERSFIKPVEQNVTFLREIEWIRYLSCRGNIKNKIWERKQNTERVREIRGHHEKTLVKKLCIQTGVKKTCPSSTKRSWEINKKPGHWMEEKWEIRCWNRDKIIVSRNSLWMQERDISWCNSREEVAIFWVSQAMLFYVLSRYHRFIPE